jgi:hypothetical protein
MKDIAMIRQPAVRVKKLSAKEAKALFERQVRQSLRMEPADFVLRLRDGSFRRNRNDSEVMRLAMLAPLGR